MPDPPRSPRGELWPTRRLAHGSRFPRGSRCRAPSAVPRRGDIPAGKQAAVAVKFAAGDLRSATDADRSSYLELAARACGADDLADRLSAVFPDRPWHVPRARWRRSAHLRVQANQKGVVAVATWKHDGEILLISGGEDGSVRLWDVGTRPPFRRGADRVREDYLDRCRRRPRASVGGGGWFGGRLFSLPALEPLTKPRRVHKRVDDVGFAVPS